MALFRHLNKLPSSLGILFTYQWMGISAGGFLISISICSNATAGMNVNGYAAIENEINE